MREEKAHAYPDVSRSIFDEPHPQNISKEPYIGLKAVMERRDTFGRAEA